MTAMTLIESKTLGADAASIEFTSIPQDFTDLYVLLSLRMARATTGGGVDMKINTLTTGFTKRILIGSGSAGSSDASPVNTLFFANGANQTANTFGNVSMYFPNYAGSTNKSFSIDAVDENNATESYQEISANLWSNTAAITSLSWSDAGASNWVTGTTVSLYGILKGSDGIVTTS
jgi:hypothetical protein